MKRSGWLVITTFVALALLSCGMGITRAYLVDLETSSNNALQAWTSTAWTQTSQADFESGISNQVDTSTSPGNVMLEADSASGSPPTLVGSWTGETDYNTNGFNYTPGAGSNRVALVLVTAESNSNPVANMNQVTLGGQALTAIESADGVVVGSAGSYHNLIWFGYLNETGIGNMSGNALNISWDTTPNQPPIMVQAATYQNVDQTTPIADSASNTNTSAGSIQAGSVSVGENDRLVYVTLCGNPADHTAPGGYAEQLEQNGSANTISDASVQRTATTVSTENPTATWSITQRLAIISAVLNAASGGGGQGDWYDNDWSNRREMTIDHSLVTNVSNPSSTYAEFPVLVYATGLSNINANGTDIRFTASNGVTELPREIESYSGGTLYAWVKVTLTKDAGDSTDDTIYMYYGNTSATEPDPGSTYGSQNVWNSSYKGVWHLKETSGAFYESTSNPNDGDDYVSATDKTGQIYSGQGFDGGNDWIDLGNDTSLQVTTVTVEAWCKPAVTGAYMGIGGKLQSATYAGFAIAKADDNRFRFQTATGGVSNIIESNSAYADTDWHHVVGVRSGGTNYLFVDGVQQTQTSTASISDSGLDAHIGRQYVDYDGRWWNGNIDEFRISGIGRGAPWIETEYNNQDSPASFCTLGSEEEPATGGADSVTDTFDDESMIDTKSNLVVTGGQVKLTSSGSGGTETLRPDAAGTYSQCDAVGDSPNYQCVDETVADTSTYVRTNFGATEIDTYNLDDHSLGTGTINSVTVHIMSRVSSFGSAGFEVAIRTHDQNYYGDYTEISSTSFTDINETWTENPYTSNPWTWTEIDDLQAGVRQTDVASPNPETTQVYIEVDYSGEIIYDSPGTMTSTNLLSGETVSSIDSFDYTVSTIPGGTSLKVQFSQNGSSWYDSSGTPGAWDTLSQGTYSINLTALSWSGANFYYKMEFTSDGTDTPVLDEIEVNFSSNSYLSPGTLASQVLDTGISGDRWDGLFWTESLPANTDITFEVRASDTLFAAGDATPSWSPVGGTSPVTSGLPAGRYMQWRANLTASDSNVTPTLSEVTVYHY